MVVRSAGVCTLALACAITLGAGLPSAHADRVAAAGGADTITSSGQCSAGSAWTMGARAQRRGIMVAVRVDSGRPGQRWRLLLRHNGVPVAAGPRGTGARGVATIRRRTANLPGVDTYTFTARNPADPQTCTGALAF